MTPQDGITHARQQARRLQHRLGAEWIPYVNVYAFADRLNVQIVDADLEGALAQLVVNGASARILLSTRLRDPARRRIAIAHELGHYLLSHPSPAVAELCGPRPRAPQEHAADRDVEAEADGFVLELLLPAAKVDEFCRARDPDFRLCAQLAIAASVPIEHAAMRIAERSDRICAAVLSTPAAITSVTPSRRFLREFGASLASMLRDGQALDSRTVAWRILDRSARLAPAEVPAEAWLGGPGLPLFESSAPVAHDGAILTMLRAQRLEDTRASMSRCATAS